jgi:large subunit ribosomal protein L25
MSEHATLSAQLREGAGKGAARATRRAGLVPGVVYGNKQAPTLISIEPKFLVAQMRTPGFRTRLFDIDLGNGVVEHALCKDVQLHPVKDTPVHVDFVRVSKESVVHVKVPIHFNNQDKSPGLKRGGVLNVVMHDIDLICPPEEIPHSIDVDCAGLDIGDSVHVKDLAVPAGIKLGTIERGATVVSIAPPTVVRTEG